MDRTPLESNKKPEPGQKWQKLSVAVMGVATFAVMGFLAANG